MKVNAKTTLAYVLIVALIGSAIAKPFNNTDDNEILPIREERNCLPIPVVGPLVSSLVAPLVRNLGNLGVPKNIVRLLRDTLVCKKDQKPKPKTTTAKPQ